MSVANYNTVKKKLANKWESRVNKAACVVGAEQSTAEHRRAQQAQGARQSAGTVCQNNQNPLIPTDTIIIVIFCGRFFKSRSH